MYYYAVNSAIWTVVSFVLAIVGGFVIYFVFLNKKNEGRFYGFLQWLYDFLSFKKMFIEAFLKIAYLITAIFITLLSLSMITNFFAFLMLLVVGNVVARAIYEFALVTLVMCRNTTEINDKLSGKKDDNNQNM